MASTLMTGAAAAGQAYNGQVGNLFIPTRSDPSKSSAGLWEGKLQIHPNTKHGDPVYKRFTGDQCTAQRTVA
jgi:P-type Ca2+ transporter type 2C